MALSLQCVQRLPATLEQRAASFGKLYAVTELEGVIVGDNDLGAVQVGQHILRDQFAALVMAIRIVGLQHTQTVLYCQTRRYNQETSGEVLAVWPAISVDRLPRNNHGHDCGFPRTGGQLQRHAHQFGICISVRILQMLQKSPAGRPHLMRNLSQPDSRLDGLDLAEERTDVVELVVTPVLQEVNGLWCYLPVVRIGQASPLFNVPTDLIDVRGRVILLRVSGDRLDFPEWQRMLIGGRSASPWLRYRRDELRTATAFDDSLCWLALGIEFPVLSRLLVGGIQNRLLKN